MSEGHLYIISNSALYRIENPDENTDKGVMIGTEYKLSVCMVHLYDKLYIIQDRFLLRIEAPFRGEIIHYVVGSGTWVECSCMAVVSKYLFIIQNGTLYKVMEPEKNSDSFKQVGEVDFWKGSTSMTALNGKLFIIKKSRLFRIDIGTNFEQTASVGSDSSEDSSSLIVSLKNMLFILQESSLYRVDAPDKDIDSWKKIGDRNWKSSSAMTCVNNKLLIIQNGTFYRIENPFVDADTWKQVGTIGRWKDVTCMTYIKINKKLSLDYPKIDHSSVLDESSVFKSPVRQKYEASSSGFGYTSSTSSSKSTFPPLKARNQVRSDHSEMRMILMDSDEEEGEDSTYDDSEKESTKANRKSEEQKKPNSEAENKHRLEGKLGMGLKEIGIISSSLLENFTINPGNIEIRSNVALGNPKGGTFGVVYPIIWINRGGRVNAIIKLLKNSEKIEMSEYFRECGFMFSCLHPCVIRIYGIVKTNYDAPFEGRLGFVMEEMQRNVKEFLVAHEQDLYGEDIIELMIQMTQGLVFIHDKKIIHFDIKLENYLVDFHKSTVKDAPNKIIVKLTDFGISRKIMDEKENSIHTQGGKGTRNYMAPEVFAKDQSDYGTEVDIYSLGVCFYRMFEGLEATPFLRSGDFSERWKFKGFNRTPSFLRDNLILKMLNPDPDERRAFSAEKVLGELFRVEQMLENEIKNKEQKRLELKQKKKFSGFSTKFEI